MVMRNTFTVIIFTAMAVSGYFVFQCTNVVAYNSYSRSIVASTRLLNIEFLDTSPAVLENGYFTVLITFENPTNRTLNMTKLQAAPYQPYEGGSARIALGEIEKPIELGPGNTQVVLHMNIDTGSSFAQPSYWLVIYRLKFGSVHYSFNSEMRNSAIETKGPFSIWENEASTQITTNVLFTVDTWAVGLEAIAVLILLQERREDEAPRGRREDEHNRMLAVIYALQGIGIITPLFFSAWINAVLSEPPPEFYYQSGAGAIAVDIFRGLIYLAALIFLLTAWGLLLRNRAAMRATLFLSSISGFVSLLAGVLILTRLATMQDLALATLSLTTFTANVIAMYILLKKGLRR